MCILSPLTNQNRFGGKSYSLGSFMEFLSLSETELSILRPGDAIVDRDGQGRTRYVHTCSKCGKLYLHTMREIEGQLCPECNLPAPDTHLEAQYEDRYCEVER